MEETGIRRGLTREKEPASGLCSAVEGSGFPVGKVSSQASATTHPLSPAVQPPSSSVEPGTAGRQGCVLRSPVQGIG